MLCSVTGVRDQQLVTWSRDQSLRIWRIEPNLQRVGGVSQALLIAGAGCGTCALGLHVLLCVAVACVSVYLFVSYLLEIY